MRYWKRGGAKQRHKLFKVKEHNEGRISHFRTGMNLTAHLNQMPHFTEECGIWRLSDSCRSPSSWRQSCDFRPPLRSSSDGKLLTPGSSRWAWGAGGRFWVPAQQPLEGGFSFLKLWELGCWAHSWAVGWHHSPLWVPQRNGCHFPHLQGFLYY